MRELLIFIPYNLEYSIINNNKINNMYIYNSNYYFSISLNQSKFFINKNTNIIKILDFKFNSLNKLANYELKNFLFSWDNIYFNKIKFTGKGFKFKKRRIIYFYFSIELINVFL